MTIDFGWEPQEVHINLSAGQDFVLEIAPTDPTAIPDASTCVIILYPPGAESLAYADWPTPLDTWTASIASGVVSWDVESGRSDVIPHLAFARVILTYPTAESYVWARGLAHRND